MSSAALRAVFRHSASKGSARLVLLAMADEAASDGRLTAYKRSHSDLAVKANCDPGTVARAIRALRALGEVETLVAGVGATTSDYRIVLPGLDDDEDGSRRDAYTGSRRDAGTVSARRLDGLGETPTPPADLSSLKELTPSFPLSPAPSDANRVLLLRPDDLFDAFWRAYPRKADKGQARRAWTAAVKAADPAAIVDGARRYAAERRGEDPKFTKHPSTWLRAEAWGNEPAGRSPSDPRRVADSWSEEDRTGPTRAREMTEEEIWGS